MSDFARELSDVVREAAARRTPLRIVGGGTKDFYGGPVRGEPLAAGAWRGIVDYDPTELVITARAGTPLTEIEAALREKRQMLAFEPPHFGTTATIGGCIAAGLSGPRRASAGAVRDFVLGVRILDGDGMDLRFGGRVMKNVAGYDVSRLMAGSMGTLGVILEASLKVLPLPPAEATGIQEQTDACFDNPLPLWRLSLKPTTPPLELSGSVLIEWGGALRWLKTDAPAHLIRDAAARAGGHATLFRGGDKTVGVFQPLPAPLMKIHQRLKQGFDPAGILNPGRLYPDL
jgi:glycolate oxidase FAD binding subunit